MGELTALSLFHLLFLPFPCCCFSVCSAWSFLLSLLFLPLSFSVSVQLIPAHLFSFQVDVYIGEKGLGPKDESTQLPRQQVN